MSQADEHQEELTFGGSAVAIFGALCGLAFALAVPWVVLVHGQALGEATQRTLVIGAISVGGLTCFLCALLGVVMPRQISHNPHSWSHYGQPPAKGSGPPSSSDPERHS